MVTQNSSPEKHAPLSQKEFAVLGMNDLAYIRAVAFEAGTGYMIHAADGTALGMAENRDLAFAAARRHGLEPADVN